VWDAGSPNDASGILFRGRGRNGQQRGGAPGARGCVVWAVSAGQAPQSPQCCSQASEKNPAGWYGARAGERGRLQPIVARNFFHPSPSAGTCPPCLRAGGTYSLMFGPPGTRHCPVDKSGHQPMARDGLVRGGASPRPGGQRRWRRGGRHDASHPRPSDDLRSPAPCSVTGRGTLKKQAKRSAVDCSSCAVRCRC
jgi:hypothetical protein